MSLLSQFVCYFKNQETISLQLMQSVGVEPRHIYTEPANIISVAKKEKESRSGKFINLPFCHTVEAKALGADIRPADAAAGPRPRAYALNSLEDFPKMNLANDPDVSRLLQACRELSKTEESIIYQITGPISILSCLTDMSNIFKAWRKSPEIMENVFKKLRFMLLGYCRELRNAGVSHIAFADPVGAPEILGPKYTKLITAQFILPFLRELIMDCSGDVIVIVCPLTVAALSKTGAICETESESGVFICSCVKKYTGSGGDIYSFS